MIYAMKKVGEEFKKRLIIHFLWISVQPHPPLSTLAKIINIHIALENLNIYFNEEKICPILSGSPAQC